MEEQELNKLLNNLLRHGESRTVEFREARNLQHKKLIEGKT